MNGAAVGLLLAGLAVLLAHGYRLYDRLRFRAFPMPRFPAFLLGHMASFRNKPMYLCYQEWSQQLGGIFLIFLGKEPVVVLSDPELTRQVCVKRFASWHDRIGFVTVPPSSSDRRIRMLRAGVLVAEGSYWASLRAAINPLFHTSALQGYAPLMNRCLGKLAEQLDAVAGTGQAVNFHALAGRCSLQIIGQAAFGVDLGQDSPDDVAEQERQRAAGLPNLPAALRLVFSGNTFAPGGMGILFRLLPRWAEPWLFHLLFRAWGKVGKGFEYARTTLCLVSAGLLRNAAARAAAADAAVSMAVTDWKWWGQDLEQKNSYRDAVPAEGSVIDLLMHATNKETGQGLSDFQIVAQCNTLIAAGYETTANALSFTLYLLAKHPEVEAEVLREVDAFGRDKEPSYHDLERLPYTAACINEALRLFPPAHTTTRVATADCVIGGSNDSKSYHVPKGSWLHIAIYAMHHDPKYWPQPEVFLPQRFLGEHSTLGPTHPAAYQPFGLGPRNCVGMRFALEELHLAVVRLYQRFTFQLDPKQAQEPLALRMGITLTPAKGVWLRVQRRAN